MKIMNMRSNENQDLIKHHYGYPFSQYIMLVLPILLALLGLGIKANMNALLIYLAIGVILFYVFFVRYSSKVVLKGNFLQIIYFAPWNQSLYIDISKYKYFHYGLSFYSAQSPHISGHLSLFRICYDVLILSENPNQAQLEIKINTRIFGFRRILSLVQDDLKLKSATLSGSSIFIW